MSKGTTHNRNQKPEGKLAVRLAGNQKGKHNRVSERKGINLWEGSPSVLLRTSGSVEEKRDQGEGIRTKSGGGSEPLKSEDWKKKRQRTSLAPLHIRITAKAITKKLRNADRERKRIDRAGPQKKT